MDIQTVKQGNEQMRVISLVRILRTRLGPHPAAGGFFWSGIPRVIPRTSRLKDGPVTVELDGALGLPASFLDEAFGPLSAHVDAKRLFDDSSD